MKVIHTFIPSNPHPDKGQYKIIWKEIMYVQMLSVLLAKREQGGIDLFTNEDLKKQIVEIGLPYDSINTEVLKESRSDLFCIPKLRVYKEMKEPFVHIDVDTLIYSKIDFSKYDSSIIFSHPDLKKPRYDNYSDKTKDIFSSYPSLNNVDTFFKSAGITYLNLFNRLSSDHSDFKLNNIRISEVPNMNIIIANDYEKFGEASLLSLDHYNKNKNVIDLSKNGECYSEQLMIHLNLLEISENYREDVKDGKTFLLKDTPISVDANFNSHLDLLSYPFTILHNSHLDDGIEEFLLKDGVTYKRFTEYHNHVGRTTRIDSKKELINLFDFNFYGISHLTFYKWTEIFQAIVIGYIVNNFGEEYVRSIYEYYKIIYPSTYNLPRLSKGEILYQDLTGFKFDRNVGII